MCTDSRLEAAGDGSGDLLQRVNFLGGATSDGD
jgi:hypothetical protein